MEAQMGTADGSRARDGLLPDRSTARVEHIMTEKPLWRAVAEAHRNLPILGKPGDTAANLSYSAPPFSVGALALAHTSSSVTREGQNERKRPSTSSDVASALDQAFEDAKRARGPHLRKRIQGVTLLREHLCCQCLSVCLFVDFGIRE